MASRAMVMFSRAWGWDWGRLLCRSFRFCNVSTRATNLKHRRDVMRNRIVKLRCDEKVHKTVMESITWVVNKPYTGTQPLLYKYKDWAFVLLGFSFWNGALNQNMPIGINCDRTEWLRRRCVL